jgi:FtsZ-binding cell division protein ZapB
MIPTPRFPARIRGARLVAASMAWAMLASVSAFGIDEPSAAAPPAPPSVDEVRSTLERYVETRRILSKERLEFARAKQAILDRIELVEREIDSFKTRISETETSLAAADEKRSELAAANDSLKAASTSLTGVIAGLEARTLALLPRLPDPIRSRVKPLSQRIPGDPATTRLSLGDRFVNVVGILNEINKFNTEITTASEVRALPDGSSVEVTAVYLGIGQGYYVNSDATLAGVGAAEGVEWTWTSENEAAPAIAKVVAILKNETPAAFVRVPMKVE